MAKNKSKAAKNVWEYADWLFNSGRITAEELSELYHLADKLEEETFDLCLPK